MHLFRIIVKGHFSILRETKLSALNKKSHRAENYSSNIIMSTVTPMLVEIRIIKLNEKYLLKYFPKILL